MEIKICNTCGEEKPLTTKFWIRDKENRDGFRGKCKQCKEKERIKYLEEHKEEFSNLTKICTKCNKELPATEEYFQKHIKGKYGLRSYCKECRSKYQKKYNKTYNHINKEKIAESSRKYYHDNKEKFKNKYKYDTDKNTLNCQKRRALKKKLAATLTIVQWEQIKTDFNNKCAYCGQKLPLEQEHFIALSNGGEFTHNNIIPACKSCNCSKHAQSFFEWYSQQPFYSKKREKFILDYLNYDKENKTQQLALDSAFFIAI